VSDQGDLAGSAGPVEDDAPDRAPDGALDGVLDGALDGAVVSPDLVISDGPAAAEESVADVTSPATVIRIGAMAKQLLEELRSIELDDPAREQLRSVYESSIDQLQAALSPELATELERLSFAFRPDSTPTDAEIRLAEAQLVGWLEGLFHGIQAMLVAQQVQAQQQLQGMRAQISERSAQAAGGPGYI
jgi:hypothetical protein